MSASRDAGSLAVVRGLGEPREMRFVVGTEVAPTSVGRKGAWRIDHPSAKRDVVGFVYFDGESVFVQSAEGADPIEIAGVRIGADWTPIEKACDIDFAGIIVRFEPAAVQEVEERTNFYTPPVPLAPAKRAPVPSSKPDFGLDAAPDSESTRVRPLDTGAGPNQPMGNGLPPLARPAAGAPVQRGGVAARTFNMQQPARQPEPVSVGSMTIARPLEVPQQGMQQGYAPQGAPNQFGQAAPNQFGQSPPRGQFSLPDNESTAYGPVGGLGGGQMPPGGGFGAPQAGYPNNQYAPAPNMMPGPNGMMPGPNGMMPGPNGMMPGPNGMMPGPNGMMPGQEAPAAAPKGLDWVKAEWSRTSIPKRVMLVMSPALLALAPGMLSRGNEAPDAPEKPVPAVTASATASAVTTAPIVPIAPTPNVASTEAPTPPVRPIIEPAQSGSAVGSAAAAPTATGAPVAVASGAGARTPAPTASATASTAPSTAKTADLMTLERQAVDAMASDRREEAARLYEQLARQYPERPAFAQAAKLLRARAAAKP